MPRYSRSRSRSPQKRRRQRSYSSSTSSRSRSRSRSPLRGRSKYQSQMKKSSRGRSRSRSRSPARKDRGSRGFRGSKQQKRRSRSHSPRSRNYGGSSSKARSRSLSRRNETGSYKQEEQSYLPPKNKSDSRGGYFGGGNGQSHQDNRLEEPENLQAPPEGNMYRDDYGKRVNVHGQLPLSSHDATYGHPSTQAKYRPRTPPSKGSFAEKDKMKYEAVSPEDLHFATKSPSRSGSPYNRKISKGKGDPLPKPYYQGQETYGPAEPQKVKLAQPPIIRPIFDPYSVKIPRRKDEGLKEIFDRPELKGRREPDQAEIVPENRFVAVTEKKEPVVYRQDVHFTGTLPSGTLPPQLQSQDFIERERRESNIMDFEPRQNPYVVPNQYPPRGNPDMVGNQYPSQPLSYQVQPNDQFHSVKDVQHLADYRQATFVQGPPPQIAPSQPNNFDDSVSYQYPPEDLPDFKGQHDLRHDLETRRKQMEQQQLHGPMRSISKSRSRSISRRRSNSHSLSPNRRYKSSSYQRSRSRSYDHSEDMRSGDRRPVRERLGDVSKRTRDDSFSDDGGKKGDWKSKQKNYFYHDDKRRDDHSNSRERDSRDKGNKSTKYQSPARGGIRGGRGRGYLGKHFIPGYRRVMTRGVGRYQRGGRGGFGKGDNSSRTWTHDLYKDKDEGHDSASAESKKDRKKAKKDVKEKDKKLVKQKVKKGKKSKKSPSRTDGKDKMKDGSQAQALS